MAAAVSASIFVNSSAVSACNANGGTGRGGPPETASASMHPLFLTSGPSVTTTVRTPPLASTLIALLKNTSVAGVFGVIEAVGRMKGFTNDYADQRVGIFIAFALGYIILVEIVSLFSSMLERRWKVA